MIQVLTGSFTQIAGTSTFYWPPFCGNSTSSVLSSTNLGIMRVPVACTIRNLVVRLSAANDGSTTHTVLFHHQGIDTSLSATVAASGSTASNAADSVNVAAGDTLVLKRTATGSPAEVTVWFSFEIETTGNVSLYGFGMPASSLSTATVYGGLGGTPWEVSVAAEFDIPAMWIAGTMTGFSVRLSAAPGAGTSRTFAVVKNGTVQDGAGGTTDTRLTIADANTTGDVTFSLSVADGDTVYIEHTASGVPTVAYPFGIVTFEATASDTWAAFVAFAGTLAGSGNPTRFGYPNLAGTTSFDATVSNRQHIGGIRSFTLTGMRVRNDLAPGTSKSWTITLRRNSLLTSQAVTLSDAETEEVTTGAGVSINSGDSLSVSVTAAGAPADVQALKVVWPATAVVTGIVGSAVFGVTTTVTATRAVAFGLDGNANVHNEAGKLKVFGDLEVTGVFSAGSGGGAGSLDDLSDVAISSAAANHVLNHNGSVFVNTATPQLTRLGVGVAADSSAVVKVVGQYGSTTNDAGNSSTAITIDWDDGNTQLVTLTGNATFTLNNPKDGFRYLLALEQDGTGSRTVTWPASVKWAGGAAPTLSTAAGRVDIVTLVWMAGLGASGNYLAAASLDFTPA